MEGKDLPNHFNEDTLNLRGITIKKEYFSNLNNNVLKDCDIKLECTHDQQPFLAAVKLVKDEEDSSRAEDPFEVRKVNQSKSTVMKTLKVVLEKVDKPVKEEPTSVSLNTAVMETKKQLESSEFMALVNSLKYHSRVVLKRVDVQLPKNTSDVGNFRSKVHSQGIGSRANAALSIRMNPKVVLEKLDPQILSDTSNVAGIKTFVIGHDKQNLSRPYACSECPSKFKRHHHLKYHMTSHTGERPYACTRCPLKFKRHHHLKDHMMIHSDERPYACSHCPLKFKRLYCLKEHLMLHTSERLFSCSCTAAFVSKSLIMKHLKNYPNHKPLNRSCFVCTHCGKRLLSLGNLRLHLKIHTCDRPYACTQCPSKFRRSHHLKDHVMYTHTGERPFSCMDCAAAYVSKFKLMKHLENYPNHKPLNRSQFVCTHCSKRFLSLSRLKVHTRIHAGERLFSCVHCAAKFLKRAHLTDHMMTHTGEKPSLSFFCPMKFALKKGVNINIIKTHADAKPFPCDHCPARFVTKFNLKRHVLRAHTNGKS